MAAIDEIDITSLLFQEGSAPTTPAATKWRAYFKTDGLYVMDDAGTEYGPFVSPSAAAAYIDFAEGAAPATPGTGVVRQYAKTDGNLYQKDDAGTETQLPGGGGGSSFSGAKISDPSGADQAVTATSENVVTFDTEDFDTDGYADLGTNNERLTIPETAYYLVSAAVEFGGASGGNYAYMSIWKNGTGGTRLLRVDHETQDGTQDGIMGSVVVSLALNDYVQVSLNPQSADQDIFHTAWAPWLSVVKLGT